MMHLPNMTTTLLFSAATGILSAYLAYRRGRNPYIWFFIGGFFGLLGTIFLFFAPRSKKAEEASKPLTPPKSEPYLFGPAEKFWYYLDNGQAQIGPIVIVPSLLTGNREKLIQAHWSGTKTSPTGNPSKN